MTRPSMSMLYLSWLIVNRAMLEVICRVMMPHTCKEDGGCEQSDTRLNVCSGDLVDEEFMNINMEVFFKLSALFV